MNKDHPSAPAQSEPEASGNANFTTVLCPSCGYARATTTTRAAREAERGRLENLIDDYLADYNFEGDNGCGYCPSDDDKFVMKDAIMGLIADEEFGALFAQTQPQAKEE